MYSVSSGFSANAAATNAVWKRKLTIGSSDYSSNVIRWPRIQRQWDDIRPGTVTIDLTNEDKTFNFFIQDKTKLRSSCAVKMGFEYAVGSDEYVTMFSGRLDAVRFRDGRVSLTIVDKFKQLSERIIGDSTTPANYTGSSYLVHDLAWYFVTSYGGYSAVRSTSNPDIDWASYNSWTAAFSTDNVRMKARLEGQKCTEALHRIANLTQSAIFVENDKLKFVRYTLADSSAITLDADSIMDVDYVIDDRELINRFYVGADYDVTSDYFKITVVTADSASVNSFGLREDNIFEKNIWLTDSVSALNLSQRIIQSSKIIDGQYSVRTPLNTLVATIGDTITFVDSALGINEVYRMMSETVDMESATKSMQIDQSQLLSSFRLDYSALDGTDVLS